MGERRKNQIEEWMQRPDWLRGAAKVRISEALRHPENSGERRRQLEIATDYERRAMEAERGAR